jgi:hypothetical protein
MSSNKDSFDDDIEQDTAEIKKKRSFINRFLGFQSGSKEKNEINNVLNEEERAIRRLSKHFLDDNPLNLAKSDSYEVSDSDDEETIAMIDKLLAEGGELGELNEFNDDDYVEMKKDSTGTKLKLKIKQKIAR